MIYVSEDQLEQVEYLIGQSIQGNHILFDQDTIKRVFGAFDNDNPSEKEAYGVEHHIERMILQPTLLQKRAYLEKLDHKTFELVVRTYFNIVENSLFEQTESKH